jgi:adenosylcobyric acid synthase
MSSNNTKLKLRPIMFVGTGSDVGKSIINAAFCRIFKQDGYNPAPFKAQNMSLNSYATPEGGEIGRAQAVQAEAAGIACHTDMNPILLKPLNNMAAQIILHGKAIGNQTAQEYFYKEDRDKLFKEAMEAYHRLEKKYNPMVIEGAGSISEINLRDKDITNMRVAIEAGAAAFLVTDIDRGGVFGSVVGTLQLLTPEERNHIKGIIINKFRGDIELFKDGRQMLETLTGKPVIGVIPYFTDIIIEDEDSVALETKRNTYQQNKINIAVVLVRHMSNFTDINVLSNWDGVNLYFAATPEDLKLADLIIIPGSKSTINDLMDLKKRGLADSIINAHKQGKGIYGICGGYQMMGMEILDPDQIEGTHVKVEGLGMLPVKTIITGEKTVQQRDFYFRGNKKEKCHGYEIHMGVTNVLSGDENPLLEFSNGSSEGYYKDDKTWGTYVHGIFDNESVIKSVLTSIGNETKPEIRFSHGSFKEMQYNKLATLIKSNLDMDRVYEILSA